MQKRKYKHRKDSKLFGHMDEAEKLYKSGKSFTEIGEIFGIHHTNVYRTFILNGIKTRNQADGVRLAFKTGRTKIRTGKDNHAWRGGKTKHSQGYILISMKDHPKADCRGYVYEHVLVAEKILNRRLKKNEIVHHKNGKQGDNRPSNLEVMSDSAHKRLHAKMQNNLIGINKKQKNIFTDMGMK